MRSFTITAETLAMVKACKSLGVSPSELSEISKYQAALNTAQKELKVEKQAKRAEGYVTLSPEALHRIQGFVMVTKLEYKNGKKDAYKTLCESLHWKGNPFALTMAAKSGSCSPELATLLG